MVNIAFASPFGDDENLRSFAKAVRDVEDDLPTEFYNSLVEKTKILKLVENSSTIVTGWESKPADERKVKIMERLMMKLTKVPGENASAKCERLKRIIKETYGFDIGANLIASTIKEQLDKKPLTQTA